MWDLKLILIDSLFSLTLFFIDLFSKFIDLIDPFYQNGLYLFNTKISYQFPQNMTFFFAVKFCLCISFLILVRGGTPRYRYDYLTKLGWLKFLSLIILIFSSSLVLFFLF